MVETLLIVLVIFALAVTAFLTIAQWKTSRTPTKQVAPEVVTKRWLNQAAHNAREQEKVG